MKHGLASAAAIDFRGLSQAARLQLQQRLSGATKFRRVVVSRRIVELDRRNEEAWRHTLVVMDDDMSRPGVMCGCGVSRSTQRNQQAQGQRSAHRIYSHRPKPLLSDAQAAAPQSAADSQSITSETSPALLERALVIAKFAIGVAALIGRARRYRRGRATRECLLAFLPVCVAFAAPHGFE